MKLGAIHKTGKFYKQIISSKEAFSVFGNWCTVKLCSMQYPFFLQDNTVSSAMSLERSPRRVPPKMKRTKLEKKESEQPTGTIHEMQQRNCLPGK